MADVLDIEVVIRRNGRVMSGFPYVRRLVVTEAEEVSINKSGTDGAGVFVALPGVNFIPSVNALFLRTDTSAVNFGFNNNLTPFLQLNAGGFILAVDCNLTSGASSNILINNNTTNVANIRGFLAGT